MSDSTTKIETLKQQILEHRCSGEVYVEIHKKESPKLDLDQFVSGLPQGFTPLGSSWREIDRAEAQEIILLILSRDLAYQNEVIDRTFAESLTQQFLDLFQEPCQYFTNGNFRDYYLNELDQQQTTVLGWMPLTQATFDTGVVCFDQDYAGLIWVEDED